MFSYYMQDRAYYYADDDETINHLDAINTMLINADENDHFFQSRRFGQGLYDKSTTIDEYFNSSRIPGWAKRRVLPEIGRRVKHIDEGFMSLANMDAAMTRTSNAFLGPWFFHDDYRLITCYGSYVNFRYTTIEKTISNANFEKCCKIILKNVIVTNEAYKMVRSVGKAACQMFERLTQLEKYVGEMWKGNEFNEKDVTARTPLTITDESETTKTNPQYKDKRRFRIPGLGSQYCFLHIKTGDYRFHIFPDCDEKKVYVPYIGPHLPTKQNP